MISVLLHTTQNLGDHGKEITLALNVDEGVEIRELVERFLKDQTTHNPNIYDHIEIRICKGEIGG